MTTSLEQLAQTEPPPMLRGRPRDTRGFPIPFVTKMTSTGPDFTAIDGVKWERCVYEHRCALCGKHLQQRCVVIGGPLVERNHVVFDPPMHEACARFALKTCPFLAFPQYRYSKASREALERGEVVPGSMNEKPEKIGLFTAETRTIQEVRTDKESLVGLGPWLSVEWVEYERA